MAAMINNESQDRSQLCDEIDEYFRKNFRKISYEDARDIIKGIGYHESTPNNNSKIQGLDDKFWVWETLEEATRPHVDELGADELMQFMTAWSLNMKGSEELNDLMHERMSIHFAEAPPFLGSKQ